ncbi:hypothetical protein PG984_009897 [Apiospora sp. TS-2023a]
MKTRKLEVYGYIPIDKVQDNYFFSPGTILQEPTFATWTALITANQYLSLPLPAMSTPTAQRQQRPGTRLSRWVSRTSAASKDMLELMGIIIALLAVLSHHDPDSSTILSRSLFLLLKLFSWIMRHYTLRLHYPLGMSYKPSTEGQIGDWNLSSLLAVCGFAIYQPGGLGLAYSVIDRKFGFTVDDDEPSTLESHHDTRTGAEAKADANVTFEAGPEAGPEDEPRNEPGAEAEPRPKAMAEAGADV